MKTKYEIRVKKGKYYILMNRKRYSIQRPVATLFIDTSKERDYYKNKRKSIKKIRY